MNHGRGSDSPVVNYYISGGQGGNGGGGGVQGYGGTGGAGGGPNLHFHFASGQLTMNNLDGSSAVMQAQIANHCPPPSRVFQGRKTILGKMHQFFTSDKGKQHIYVLYGLGGAGKTQIALKFIKEPSSCFSDVFLVDTSTKDTISTGLKNIAVAKNVGDSSKDGLLWLTSKVEEWLLFFDNADDPSIDLNDFIPQCEHGNVIITSRNPELRVHAGAHSLVSNMEEEDAVALLLKSAKQDASPSNLKFATEIVKTLGYLALAITQAGAFISKSEDLSSYLDLYKKNQARLLAEKPSQSHDHYAWTVYTTWQISFDRLKAPAAMFLLLCSFLHHEGISEDIFRNASMYEFPCDGPSKAKLKEPLKFLSYFLGPTREWDSLQFLDVTNEIKAYSLIRFDSEKKVFAIHPLVHVWSRTILTDQESYEFIIRCILGMAIANIPEQDMQLASLKMLPHLESSQHFETHVVTLFKEAYWRIYYESGKANQAKVFAVDVFEQQKISFGEDHLGTLRAGANLASTYRKLGQLKMAEELEVVVLEKCKQLLGDDHPDTLCAMGNLAITSLDLGERKTAEELQVVVLEKRTQLLGDSHPNILHAMGNLALTYSKLGEFRKAQELEVVVLEKWKQHLGDSHPDTLRAMGNLAFTYSKLGDFRRAEELQVLVLEKHKQLLSENHLGTLSAMGNLGSTYLQLGEFRKAEELNVIVLEKRKQLLGDSHPDTLHAISNMGSTYSKLGEFRKAEELNVIVLEKRRQLLGDNHPDTLHAMGNLASTYWRLGDFQKAEELQVLVLKKNKQLWGDNHPSTLSAMGNLGSTYLKLGEFRKAEEFKVLVLEKQKQILGEDHPTTLRAMRNLAYTYRHLKKVKEAEEIEEIEKLISSSTK